MVRAKLCQGQAFRPGTAANHKSMINKYVTFCRTYNVDHIDPSPQTLCAYMEYLVDHFTSPNSVLNYISAIKLLHNYRGKEATAFKCFDVILMIRAIKITMRTIPHRAPPLSVDILKQLCHKCQKYVTVGLTVRLAMQICILKRLQFMSTHVIQV